MKPKTRLRHFLFAAASAIASLPHAGAAEYWWNQNDTTAGWGAGGTWDTTSAVFSTTNSDTASAGTATTITSDTLYIGTSAVGFTGGTITGNGATRHIGTIVTGSANNTADINLTNIKLTFTNPGTITNNSPRALAISGVFEGAARLDLNANGGDIQLTGVGSLLYTGIIYINTGTVLTNNVNVLGASGSDSNRTVIASGARLVFNNSPRTYTERFEIAGAGVGGATGAFYNSGNRSTTLNGQVTLSGDATSYSDSTANALTFGGGIVLGANALTFNSVNAGSIQTVQTTAISGTNGSVVKAGIGILNLNVASTYTGGTTLNAGTINIGAAISGLSSALGSTGGQLTVNGGTLNMAGNNVTVGNLTGTGGVITGSSGTRTLTIGSGDAGGGNFQGVIGIGTGGTTALTKTGNGTITLSGANTYSGGTTVSGGTLLVNNTTGSGTGTGNVQVADGGTLGGSGIISGNVTTQDGGTFAAGTSIESFATGALTMEAGSTFAYEANNDAAAGIAGDLTVVTGNLTFDLTNAAILLLNDLGSGSWEANEKLTLISYTGTWNGGLLNYLGGAVADDSTIVFSGYNWTFNYNDMAAGTNYLGEATGSRFVTMTAISAIPEPSAALFGGLGLLFLLRRRR